MSDVPAGKGEASAARAIVRFRSQDPVWKRNEILEHKWSSLNMLWRGCRAAAPEQARLEIDELFERQATWCSDPPDWLAFNQAEQLVGSFLTADQARVEILQLIDIADRAKLPSLPVHEKNLELSKSASIESQRVAYLALLQDVQAMLIDRRFDRKLRRDVASRLVKVGLIVLGIAALVQGSDLFVDSVLNNYFEFDLEVPKTAYGLLTAASGGALGAYFSRLLAFQSRLGALTYDTVMNEYVERMLVIRGLCGVIGAVVLYYLISSSLVSGMIFPDLSKSPLEGEPLAKLAVWSFIAGFSERLVPDALHRVEARSKADRS